MAVQLAVHPRCARLAVAAGLHKSVAIRLPCGSRVKPKLAGKALESEEAESGSKGSRDRDYEFEAKEAWWLDQSEVRQALPVNELAR